MSDKWITLPSITVLWIRVRANWYRWEGNRSRRKKNMGKAPATVTTPVRGELRMSRMMIRRFEQLSSWWLMSKTMDTPRHLYSSSMTIHLTQWRFRVYWCSSRLKVTLQRMAIRQCTGSSSAIDVKGMLTTWSCSTTACLSAVAQRLAWRSKSSWTST